MKIVNYTIIFLVFLFGISLAGDMELNISGTKEKISSFEKDGIVYFSFSEFTERFGGLLDWEVIGHTVRYTEDTINFEFLLNSPFIKRNDETFNIIYPAQFEKGMIYLPAETFIPYLNEVFYQKISYDKKDRRIEVNSDYYNVNDISFAAKANGLLIEVFLNKAMAYDVFVTEGNWINISIRDAKLNRPNILARKNSRFMYQLKAYQQNQNGQISIRLKRKVEKWHHKFINDPPRIQISISDVDFEMEPGDSMPREGLDNKIDVIVIDPGHGGEHYGAVGRKKTKEKDVALDIAKELAKLIRKDKEFKVIMTRDRDKTVTLEDRAKIANDAACDLFISIHANSSVKKHIQGWNVFFLAQAKNDSARSVAQFENSAFLRDKADELNYGHDEGDFEDPIMGILNEMLMTEFQTESHDFAMMIDREFRRNLETPARGVDQAGFFVLNRVFAPSVLVESAFISNEKEEKLLKDSKYQKKIAESIYTAIKRFKSKYEGM